MSQTQNTHPSRDWLVAWTWPMFLQLQLGSRTQYMRIRQESKRATGCGNTTGTDWIICKISKARRNHVQGASIMFFNRDPFWWLSSKSASPEICWTQFQVQQECTMAVHFILFERNRVMHLWYQCVKAPQGFVIHPISCEKFHDCGAYRARALGDSFNPSCWEGNHWEEASVGFTQTGAFCQRGPSTGVESWASLWVTFGRFAHQA